MSEDSERLKAAQALSQEIDRGFPSIPQSQLDDLIPLDDDEDAITCPSCNGMGKVGYEWCSRCEGQGWIEE